MSALPAAGSLTDGLHQTEGASMHPMMIKALSEEAERERAGS
jgi:hypothetical protein